MEDIWGHGAALVGVPTWDGGGRYDVDGTDTLSRSQFKAMLHDLLAKEGEFGVDDAEVSACLDKLDLVASGSPRGGSIDGPDGV